MDEDVMLSDGINIKINMGGYALNIVNKVNENKTYEENGISIQTMWNEQGSGFEFIVDIGNASAEIKNQLLTSLSSNIILPVDILLIDVDKAGEIESVLSPFNGDYSEEVEYRGEMEIK